MRGVNACFITSKEAESLGGVLQTPASFYESVERVQRSAFRNISKALGTVLLLNGLGLVGDQVTLGQGFANKSKHFSVFRGHINANKHQIDFSKEVRFCF